MLVIWSINEDPWVAFLGRSRRTGWCLKTIQGIPLCVWFLKKSFLCMRSSVRLWDSQTSPAETSMCICETELDTPWRTELLGHVWKRHSGRNDWFDRKWQLQLGKHSGLPHSQQNWASLESEVPSVFLSTYLEHFGRTNNRKPKSKPACLIETRSREF